MMVRNHTRFSNVLLLMFTAAMLVPFQAVMYPLISLMENLQLKNLLGLIIMYGGFGLSLSVFLYHGFIKKRAPLCGGSCGYRCCNILQLFFRVVFPLLKSTTVTVIIFKCNVDFGTIICCLFLVIGNSDFKTLTLEIYYAKMLSGQYGNPWELIFPAVLVSIIPIIIVFLSLQKYFVKGVSDGAVKM